MEAISKKVIDALDNWHKQKKEMEYINNRRTIIEEELKALSKASDKLIKERYKYTDIAVKEHKYWKSKDNSVIVEVGPDEEYHTGVHYITTKELKHAKRFSSSIGILLNNDIPISEEEFRELEKQLMSK
jgi:hypothetical protein